jgi:hypothetical protein
MSNSQAVGVGFHRAKLRPSSVNVGPEEGRFAGAATLKTGESYVKPVRRVPTTAATVTIAPSALPLEATGYELISPSGEMHFTDELEIQAVQLHAECPTLAERLKSTAPKLTP